VINGCSQESLHPEAGVAKNPLKRGVASGSANGRKAIKQAKISPVNDAIASFEQGQLSLDRERFLWEKDRAEEMMSFRREKEANRSAESLQMMALQMKKMDLELELLRQRVSRIVVLKYKALHPVLIYHTL
jgi:hypothetical protein